MENKENTVHLLRDNNLRCCVSNKLAVFLFLLCANSDIFFKKLLTWTFEAAFNYIQWTGENVYPRNVFQVQKSLFGKLDLESFGVKYMTEQKDIQRLAMFIFESYCVQEETFKDTI